MPLGPGTRLGPYEILAPLGAGGMGEVYRARDTRLDRTVAVKVLPAELARNPEFRQRFEREAKAVSSLNHPHICALYDIGSQDGVDFLVMEYLEGETLSARLARGPLDLDQALRYAVQIADALAQAHRQGVYHRDLKPGNIMLTKSGAKLLDFGLAKLGVGSRVLGVGEPTLGADLTKEGTILGTLQYMAPEQLEGRAIDGRTDLFAFGAVLYEMVTGRKAFEGRTQASVIAAILSGQPAPISTLQPLVPPALDHVVTNCLAKDPDERWQTAGDLQRELKWIAGGAAISPSRPLAPSPPRNWPWIVAGFLFLLLVAALSLTLRRSRESPGSPAVVRFSVYPPEKGSFSSPVATVSAVQLALSPDGRLLTFSASTAGAPPLLWLRSLDESQARPLPGTEHAAYPFWSPDGRAIGFFAQGKLKRIDIGGGPPQVLGDASSAPGGGAWNAEGMILFCPSISGPLYRVPAGGGAVTPGATLDRARQETNQRFPHFLPDGRHFLYNIRSPKPEHRGVYVAPLDGKTTKRLAPYYWGAVYAWPGYLLFLDGTTLMAQPFDADRLELTGSPVPVAQQVGVSTSGYMAVSASRNGVLAYSSAVGPASQLTWFDHAGKPLGAIDRPGDYADLRLSPDGKRVALTRVEPGASNLDIWLHDLSRGATSRFTFDPMLDASPVWSPDGNRIAFRSQRNGIMELFEKPSGGGSEELLFSDAQMRATHGAPANPIPTDWSPDGRFLVYSASLGTTGFDIWALPLVGERKPIPVARSPFNKMHANVSGDGRWVAYTSDESGNYEVYVQSFPTAAGKSQISTNGGYEPRWRADGKELYYRAADGKLMSVAIRTEPSFEAGVPRVLFATRIQPLVSPHRQHYVPTADGQRFLINTLVEEATVSPITVVLNWTAGLKR